MPECRRCKATFPNHVIIDGKNHNLEHRKFCLTCSPFGRHNTRDITNDPPPVPRMRFCPACQTPKPPSDFYGDHGRPKGVCRCCANDRTVEKQREMKRRCIEYKGGKCVLCGYDRYEGSLDFHHLEEEQKDFVISRHKSSPFEMLKQELDKCVLVCSNCHREIHGGVAVLPESVRPPGFEPG